MSRLRELLLLVPLAGCYLFIARMNPDLAPGLPAFLVFFAVFVALPAMGLGALGGLRSLSLTERLVLGGPPSLALLFCVGYAAAALHRPWLVWTQPVAGAVACATSFALAHHKGSESPSRCPALGWADLLLLLGVFTAALALCVPKLAQVSLPDPAMLADYYSDDQGQAAYSFAALRALEHGLPVLQPLVANVPLVYHLLYNFCVATCTLLTGLHPLDQVLFLWPPALWLFLAGAVTVGCRRLAGFTLAETAIAALLLLFSGGYGFNATPSIQLFAYHHSFFVGLPAFLLFLCMLLGRLSSRREDLPVLYAGACFFVCAATKAPLLLLLPVSLLPVLALRLVRRQAERSELLLAGLAGATFFVLRATLYTDTERVALRLPNAGKLLMGSLNNLGEMSIVIGVYAVLLLLAADGNPPLRARLSRDRQYHLFCLCLVVVSAVLLKWFNFAGGDFYFYWYARATVLLAVAPPLTHILAWRAPRLAVPATVLLLALGLGFMLRQILAPDLFRGEKSWVPQNPQVKLLDRGEREGLRWASAHLDRRKIFFTNKDEFLGSYLGGYIAIDLYDTLGLSGLQGYAWAPTWLPQETLRMAVERRKRVETFFKASTPDAKAKVLAGLDADYYFLSLRQPDAGTVLPDCLREVHRMSSLVIYENVCRSAPEGAVEKGGTPHE